MAVSIENVNRVAQQFVNEASRQYPVERAILFGSYAKGTQREWSDIDIALFLRDYGGKRRQYISARLLGTGEEIVSHSWDTYIEPHVFMLKTMYSGDPFIEEILKTGRDIPLPEPTHSA